MWRPTELDPGDRMAPADDLTARTLQARHHGTEGSWGDRMSFLRAHNLVRDQYGQEVAAARAAFVEEKARTDNGVM